MMVKIPRFSDTVLIKYLIRKGFQIQNQKGVHATLKNNSLFTTVSDSNQILKTRLLLAILEDADITKAEFVDDFNNGLLK